MKVELLKPEAKIPTYAHSGDAGLDLYTPVDVQIPAGYWRNIPMGIAIEFDPGYFGLIRGQSGLGSVGVVLCGSGIIDPTYRGEIHVNLINHGAAGFDAEKGSRIAQLLVLPIGRPTVTVVDSLSSTSRGQGRHGSTGK